MSDIHENKLRRNWRRIIKMMRVSKELVNLQEWMGRGGENQQNIGAEGAIYQGI